LYERKFLNSFELLAEINRLGPEGLFDFLCSGLSPISDFPSELLARIRKVFSDHIGPQFGPELRSNELHSTVELLWYSGGREALELDGNFQDEDRVIRFFTWLAHAVYALDNVPEEAIRQIKASCFDMGVIRGLHLAVLYSDPELVADQFLKSLLRGQGLGHSLAELVTISIGRIALKECRRDLEWPRKQSRTKINHIIDWLDIARVTNAPWLSNVDELGRVKKLMKFGSLDAMHSEADKHMKRRLASVAVEVVKEEPVFADDGGAYRVVRLTTEAALDRESAQMRHCIGLGSYDRYLGQDKHLLLSLRDKLNRPHVTIQVNDGKIVQFLGKANSAPKQEYRDAALELLSIHGIAFPEPVPFDDNLCQEIEMPQVIPRPYHDFGGYPLGDGGNRP
jgi:hypothetical protein